MKEQIWFTNIKYLWLNEHFTGISILHRYMCIQVSKIIGINKEREICLPNKENIGDHRLERINMVASVYITYYIYRLIAYLHIICSYQYCIKSQDATEYEGIVLI